MNLTVFDYKKEKRKKEEHEDCWPLLNTTGGSPGTKRNAIVETPGENSMNAKGGQAGKGRGKRRERHYTFDTEQQKQGKGESRAGRRIFTPYAAGQGEERGNEKNE